MRIAVVLALLCSAPVARAQDAPPSTIVEQPYPPPPPIAEPPPLPPPAVTPPPLPDPPAQILTTPSGHLRVSPTQRQINHWRRGRIVSAVGTAFGVVGLGLSVTSAIYVLVKDYPPSANDVLAPAASPTDPGPMLAYSGASLSTISFILSASGLGIQHRALRQMGIDTDRGRFAAGTALGVIGTLSTGMSYFFGSTNYLNPHDQSVALLTTSITGTALCAIGTILYLTDSSRMKRNWKTYVTF